MTDERAEAAFRRAFAEVTAAHEPAPVEPVRRPSRRLVPVAAAAAVAVVVVGGAVLWGGGEPAAGPAEQSSVVPPENPPTDVDLDGQLGPSRPADGWRHESIRDVVVQVPQEWGYGWAPGSDWCAGAEAPSGPYVDVKSADYGVRLILCSDKRESIFGNIPKRLWSVHVELAPASTEGVADGREISGDWTRISRQIGAARITVWSDSENLADAERIVESAEIVAQDHLGCPAVSPAQGEGFPGPEPGADITSVDAEEVESIAVCLYDRNVRTGEPALIASREITGAPAVAETRAIQAAPAGGGPDRPQNCVDDMVGDTVTVLFVHAGAETRELFVHRDWCFGNGIDDGVTKRALTTENCAPLYADRVRHDSGSSAVFEVCGQSPVG